MTTPRIKEIGCPIEVIDKEFFWSKVAKGENCWLWQGAYFGGTGYGSFTIPSVGGRGAHRISWALCNGRWPSHDEHVCHRCDNPACVNPDHLFIGSRRDNMQDMWAKGRNGGAAAAHAAQTHCHKGHPLTEGNFYRKRTGANGRMCKQCSKDKREALKLQYLSGEKTPPPSWRHRYGL